MFVKLKNKIKIKKVSPIFASFFPLYSGIPLQPSTDKKKPRIKQGKEENQQSDIYSHKL